MESRSLSPRQVLTKATSCLEDGGYRRVEEDAVREWPLSNARLFEDPFGVVAVVVYETWADLSKRWEEAQTWLVDVLNQHLRREQSKAWDGYLVLLTTASPGLGGQEKVDRIRYDLSRVRKLVLTGDRLKALDDVEEVLLPLLPFKASNVQVRESSALEMVPRLLATEDDHIDPDVVQSLIEAFEDQKSLMKELHRTLQDHEA